MLHYLLLLIIILILCVYLWDKRRWKNRYENEIRVFQLVENSKDAVYYYQIKPVVKFRYISPSMEAFLGEGLLEESYRDPYMPFNRIHPDDEKVLTQKINGEVDFSQPLIQRWRDNDGVYRWFEEYARPVYEKGELIAVEGIIRNIDEKMKLQQDIEYRIHHDALTDIYNRHFFDQKIDQLNEENVALAIILCDLDELKQTNDTKGHKYGDLLIKESANLLKESFADEGMVSRVGGDEFAILVIDTTEERVEQLCQRLNQNVSEYNLTSKELAIKLSYGYTFSEQSLGNMEMLFAEADQKMYQNKRAKRELSMVTAGC